MFIKHKSMKDVCFEVHRFQEWTKEDKMPVYGTWWNINNAGVPFKIHMDIIYINKSDLGLWIHKKSVDEFRKEIL